MSFQTSPVQATSVAMFHPTWRLKSSCAIEMRYVSTDPVCSKIVLKNSLSSVGVTPLNRIKRCRYYVPYIGFYLHFTTNGVNANAS